MQHLPYLVFEFNHELISLIIRECFGASFPDIRRKKQIHYLLNYLSKLNACTVVCEKDYVDKDYLEDFSSYYVKCFNGYSSRCARLHFFNYNFSHTDFRDLLQRGVNNENKERLEALQDGYLGFMVIKLLPMTFVGRTCLKVYDRLNLPDSKIALSRTYKASLFGIDLTVNSIAFQEQDKVVSACATTSLWTLLNASAMTPDVRQIPSPSEITLNALSESPLNINGFPNAGLQGAQLIRALEKCKLKHHQIKIECNEPKSKELLESSIFAYIDSEIPVMLGASVYSEITSPSGEKQYKPQGDHLVTVLGYEKRDGDNQNVLYIHDDRVGPYVKAEATSVYTESLHALCCYSVDVQDEKGDLIREVLVPGSLIVGTYHKVRIPFWYIHYTANQFKKQFDQVFQYFFEEGIDRSHHTISCKVALYEGSTLKKQCLEKVHVHNRYELLVTSWPRYIWCLSFRIDDEQAFDFLYDATDIPQGNSFFTSIVYDINIYTATTHVLLSKLEEAVSKNKIDRTTRYESYFLQTLYVLQKQKDEFYYHLDKTFGDLRPPQYLKPDEYSYLDTRMQEARVIFRTAVDAKALEFVVTQNKQYIWVISQYGTLIIGEDIEGVGHPSLTGASPARIAGEIKNMGNNHFKVNTSSGRYSNHYSSAEKARFAEHAVAKMKALFHSFECQFEVTKEKLNT